MKWMLVVMIFGAQPVKTDLIFDTLDKRAGARRIRVAVQQLAGMGETGPPPGRGTPEAPPRAGEPRDLHSACRTGDQIGLGIRAQAPADENVRGKESPNHVHRSDAFW